MINIRDWGAKTWENWDRKRRVAFALSFSLLILLLPFAGNFSITSILNTPVASFQDVLVYPVGMFILMALGLNIVVGQSGLLDLGYVAFFAIGAYTDAILSTSRMVGQSCWLCVGLHAPKVGARSELRSSRHAAGSKDGCRR